MLSLAGKGVNGVQLLEQKISFKVKLLYLNPGNSVMRTFAPQIEKKENKYEKQLLMLRLTNEMH